jgi:ATP-dependent helicase HrpB
MLPIASIVEQLLQKLDNTDCILVAPPGAGKSTYLPLKLLQSGKYKNQQIIMLQPRQVAVRGIAQYLSSQLGQAVGQTVGYQMRGESKLSANCELIIMTEGLLSARIQRDPELHNVGLIIFDEFHERSVFSDIALGLSLEVQQGLREDLRLLVMSATLDITPIEKLLENPAIIETTGRVYPIGYHYRPILSATNTRQIGNKTQQFNLHLLSVIKEAIESDQGDVLVFLSGAGEIQSAMNTIRQAQLSNSEKINVHPLYSGLPLKAQLLAIRPSADNERKIVLATNIAETSLTLDGVGIVIDSGLEKVQRFNLARKASALNEQMISKDSSVQRAGRAGRQQAGVCYRLWSEQQQQFLIEKSPPQITQIDVSPYLLMLSEWGTNFNDLPLIDKPSQSQLDYARNLLFGFGFINSQGSITPKGKLAAQFNTHPRIANLLVYAVNEILNADHLYIFSLIASLLEGKPLSREVASIDLQAQLHYLISHQHHLLHKEAKRWFKKLTRFINSEMSLPKADTSEMVNYVDSPEFISHMLNVFTDNIGKRRDASDDFLLHSGAGVELPKFGVESLGRHDWIVCLEFTVTSSKNRIQNNNGHFQKQANHNSLIRLLLPVPASAIDTFLNSQEKTSMEVLWDENLQKVSAQKVERFGSIVLAKQKASLVQATELEIAISDKITQLLLDQLHKRDLASLLVKASNLINRINLAKSHQATDMHETKDAQAKVTFPDLGKDNIHSVIEASIIPYLHKITSWQQVEALNWHEIILSSITWEQQQFLKQNYPVEFCAPSNNKHKLQYTAEGEVILSIRLQELYGLADTPTVGRGKQKIVLSLLSPAHREIQKTKDLAGFWQGSYSEVQKDMKGRYPKHFWPDSPANAQATTKTKKHM